jgi:Cu(I)/Ag(I) efflux system membrane fusion protein
MKAYNGIDVKKVLQYSGILLLGLLIGSVFFGGGGQAGDDTTEVGKAQAAYYTCSMHPQVRSEKQGSCPLCGMDLVAGASVGSLSPGQFEMKEDALALANVSTYRVQPGSSPEHTLRLSGVIQTNEKTDAIQTTIFDGRIEQLKISAVGEYVRKGQEFGLIYSPELYLSQDKLLTSSSYKDTHVKLYEASRNGLGMWKLTDEQINQILKTREPIINFPLIADVTGTVTEVIAKPGDFYKQGDPLFKVSNLSTVWAVFDAYENQVRNLSVGQSVRIRTQAFQGQELEAKISFIEPLFDQVRRTVAVRVVLDNRKGLLKPGMFAEAIVSIDNEAQGIWIPKSAVLWTGKRSLVYLNAPSSSTVFESRDITIGKSTGDHYEVLEGLNPGDVIVVNGTFTIDAAAQLESKTSMMNRRRMPDGEIHDDGIAPLRSKPAPAEPAGQLISSYLQLKEALVASSPQRARKIAAGQLELIAAFPAGAPGSGEPGLLSEIESLVEKITNADDIEEQRAHFKPLSAKMIAFAGSVQGFGSTLYVQHCPMADGNKGADWLSLEETIANPYFGDKMLRCGKVTDKID